MTTLTPTVFVCTPDEFLDATYEERRKFVIAQIDADPVHHDQGFWRNNENIGFRSRDSAETICRTTYCAAGWAVTLAGDEWITPASNDPDEWECVWVDGNSCQVPVRAAELLGLTDHQAEWVFYEAVTPEDVATHLLAQA